MSSSVKLPSSDPFPLPAQSPRWTPHAELDEVLRRWLVDLQALLGDNLVGAYLQGSLALGDFDAASDVDFLVALREDIPARDRERLHDVHRALCHLPSPWARNLEGSYAPVARLRRLTTVPRDAPGEPRPKGVREPGTWRPGPYAYPFWFVSEDEAPVRREYDNSHLVRWVLRERGVTLCGPPPSTLIDPVTSSQLRQEMAEMLVCNQARLADDRSWFRTINGQISGVLVFAPALETIATGEVRSKKSAVTYARAQMPAHWCRLVEDAFAFRALHAADPAVNGPADPRAVAETLAFLNWAVVQSERGGATPA